MIFGIEFEELHNQVLLKWLLFSGGSQSSASNFTHSVSFSNERASKQWWHEEIMAAESIISPGQI